MLIPALTNGECDEMGLAAFMRNVGAVVMIATRVG